MSIIQIPEKNKYTLSYCIYRLRQLGEFECA